MLRTLSLTLLSILLVGLGPTWSPDRQARAQQQGQQAAPAGGDIQQPAGTARLKELVSIKGTSPLQLTGYGLVVGLDRTGDRARGQRSAPYTVQSIANMLRNFDINVDPSVLTSRNTAAVMVTARLTPFHQTGGALDVTVSSLGDARSISGGVLLQTPLLGPGSQAVYAIAQGPVSTGAVDASSYGSSVQINSSNTGRVPGGGIVQQELQTSFGQNGQLNLMLDRPDFTNASRIADAINAQYDEAAAIQHAGLIQVNLPNEAVSPSSFVGDLEGMTVEVDVPARVVINERTGTIVAGGNIRINEVMVTSGNIIVSTQRDPFVSQPGPFAQQGETVQGARGTASVEEDRSESVVLPPNTDVQQLAQTLNDLGVAARDVIAIFQAIDRAGALQGDLIIQ